MNAYVRLLDPSFLPVAAAAPPAISLTDALLLVIGATLVVVSFQLQKLLRRLTEWEARRPAPPPAPAAVAPPAPAGASAPPDSPSAEVAAAIAAVVHVVVGRHARIVSIKDTADGSQVWSLEGRRQIFASHHVR